MMKIQNNKPRFLKYNMGNFIKGLTFFTMINVILAIAMHKVFGIIGVIGIFFLVENIFFNTLFVNQNIKNIDYLRGEIDRLKREIEKIKKE